MNGFLRRRRWGRRPCRHALTRRSATAPAFWLPATGADFAYIGSASIATVEANADARYKQAIVDGSASDIIYSNLFTGIQGNYLRGSIEATGLDPNNLPVSDPAKMNFGSGGNTEAQAWKDVWGCGHGIGSVKSVLSAADFIAELTTQYEAAHQRVL